MPHWDALIARKHPVRYAFEEYLRLEEMSTIKHEFLDGQIYAMAGGSPEHSALAAAIIGHLTGQLTGSRCRVHSSDLNVRVRATGLATYPDASIIRGPWERDPQARNTVLNPTVLVEVLSPSTEEYDRGEKFEHYSQIPSLRHYVLAAQDREELEVRTRGESGEWTTHVFRSGEIAQLSSVNATLHVTRIYDDAREPG